MFSFRQDNRVMAFRARAFRTASRLAPLVLVVLAIASCGGTSEQYPQSTLHPKSDVTRMIDGVFMTTVWWALLVFVLVEGALVWAILRYRGKPGDAEPAQVHGNTTLEIVWTAIPALILAMIAVPTVRAIFETYEVPKGDALEVEVIGHQWWWEFRYPQYGVVTANELQVPAGRMVTLKMSTVDVLHAFMLPQLAGKRDLVQQRINTLWFRADSSGYYSGQCAEFCGIQHGAMRFHVAATTPAEFDAYIAGLRQPRTPGGAAAPAPAAARADTTASMGASTGGQADRRTGRQAGAQGAGGADGQIGAGAQAPAGQARQQPPMGPAPGDSTSPAGQAAKRSAGPGGYALGVAGVHGLSSGRRDLERKHGRAEPRQHRQPPLHRGRRRAQHRRKPGALDPEPARHEGRRDHAEHGSHVRAGAR